MQKSQQITAPGGLVRRASFRQRVIGGIVLLAVFILFGFLHLAAISKIDIDRWLTPCGFKQKYDLPCPTCGMTASALALVQGKVFEAFYIQPAAGILLSLLVIAAFLAFFTAVFGVYFSFLERVFSQLSTRRIIGILLVILAAGWAITLIREL